MRALQIITILIVSAVTTFGVGARSKVMAVQTQISTFTTVLSVFEVDCGRYPTTAEGLEALVVRPATIPENLWKGPYMEVLPGDPWQHPFLYRCPGLRRTNFFDLYSCGRDGVSHSGGNDPDDINNWDPNSPRQKSAGEVWYTNPANLTFGTVLVLILLAAGWCGRIFLAVRDRRGLINLFWVTAAAIMLLLIAFLWWLVLPRFSS